MPQVTMVVDMQFGSTAKGKLVQELVQTGEYSAVMRVQSVQAGHTVIDKGKTFKMRTIPCGWVNPNVSLVIGPGQFIDIPLLLAEVEMLEQHGVNVRDRLFIDYRASVIDDGDVRAEETADLTGKIGSTSEGAGASLVRKIMRSDAHIQVGKREDERLDDFMLADTVKMFSHPDYHVLIEGSQGTMLSLHTSPYYPYVTSRECTAAGVLSETGFSPMDVVAIWGTARTFPIRVGGNSGDTAGREVSWKEVAERSGNMALVPERTTVTNRQRRIFEWSRSDFDDALLLNKPTHLFLTFIDYINHEDYGKTRWGDLSDVTRGRIIHLEQMHGVRFNLLSTGEQPEHTIYR